MMNARVLTTLLAHMLLALLCVCSLFHPARATPPSSEIRVVESSRGCYLIFPEPLVSRTVVENARRRAYAQQAEAANIRRVQPSSCPSPADCGLELFTVSGSPAPEVRWVDQHKLLVTFAPGTSCSTEFCLSFKPGMAYLNGSPLARSSFSFRCQPVALRSHMLREQVGGAVLLSANHASTAEAEQLAARHEGLRACFHRVRYVPLLGWLRVGSVPARLSSVTVAEVLDASVAQEVLRPLLHQHKPESIRPETVVPQCLVARPLHPLRPGEHYELELEA